MEEILRYEHVEISYNGQPVVRDVSFSLSPGEILGIVGESGSGKSTLIKAAMGLLGPSGQVTRGDILYQGKTVVDIPSAGRRHINGGQIAMVFQNAGSSFCPIRRVGDQLYESVRAHKAISREEFYKEADALLGKLGFAGSRGILESYPFELSGGMQQRVGIAAAMLLRPKVLLADEPTSALDVSVQKQAVEEMLQVRRQLGTAIVIVTHNIGVAGAMADRVMVMRDGQCVEYGEAAQVLRDPQESYTKALMDAVPRLKMSRERVSS